MGIHRQIQPTDITSLVRPAVNDHGAATLVRLMTKDRRQVPACLGNEVSAKLHDDPGRRRKLHQPGEFFANGCQVKFLIVRTVGNAKAATEIQQRRRDAQLVSRTQRQFQRTAEVVVKRFGIQDL